MSESTYSPRKAQAAQRRADALRYRISGHTYQEIGVILGVSRRRAHQYVAEAFRRLHADVEDLAAYYRNLSLIRLERMVKALWPAVEDGDSKSAATVVTILTRQSRLLGLDAPTRLQTKLVGDSLEGWSEVELVEEAKRLGIPVEPLPITYDNPTPTQETPDVQP